MTVSRKMLKEAEIFSTLSNEDLDRISTLAEVRECEAGVTIFREKDPAEDLLILNEGKVALQMMLPEGFSHMNRRVTVDVVSRNEVVGWAALTEPYVYTLSAVCLLDASLIAVNGAVLRKLLRENDHIGCAVLSELIKTISSRLHETRRVLVSERSMVSAE